MLRLVWFLLSDGTLVILEISEELVSPTSKSWSLGQFTAHPYIDLQYLHLNFHRFTSFPEISVARSQASWRAWPSRWSSSPATPWCTWSVQRWRIAPGSSTWTTARWVRWEEVDGGWRVSLGRRDRHRWYRYIQILSYPFLSYAYTILYADIFKRVWDRIVTG